MDTAGPREGRRCMVWTTALMTHSVLLCPLSPDRNKTIKRQEHPLSVEPASARSSIRLSHRLLLCCDGVESAGKPENEAESTDPIDVHYRQLKTDMKVVEQSTDEF